ncbi:uncharacterized protein LOC121425968 [Lytechinus variegatus]|uniref:uncharacterized protein LOC121425968 n=1 Tax=Lytechinus variegatus TaxID=7654 RepID=UPI001BB2B74A|nr:uncharacterized protein LOC121425968 [Lytechinus variegatus]
MDATAISILVFFVLVFLLGVPGNILTIRVKTKRRRKTSTQTFIIILACADLFLCVFASTAVVGLSITDELFSAKACRGVYAICVASVVQSLLMMTSIAADRCAIMCYPHRKRLDTKYTCLVAGGCLVIATIFAITIGLNTTIQSYGGLVYRCNVDSGSWGMPFQKAMAGLAAFCVIVIILLYAKVYCALRKHRRVQVALGPNLSQDNSSIANKQCSLIHQSRMGPRSGRKSDIGAFDQRRTPNSGGYVATVSSKVHNQCHDERVVREACFNDQEESSNVLVPENPERNQTLAYREQGGQDGNNLPDTLAPNHAHTSKDTDRTLPGNPAGHRATRERMVNESEEIRMKQLCRSERQATTMMLVVTIILIVSWCPSVVSFVAPVQDMVHIAKNKPALYVLLYLLKLTVFISNATNPLVYTLMNKRFRDEAKKMKERSQKVA